jgi:hypothetical protein
VTDGARAPQPPDPVNHQRPQICSEIAMKRRIGEPCPVFRTPLALQRGE